MNFKRYASGWIGFYRKFPNMDEFNNRMNAQRAVLTIVNECTASREQLSGLSKKAIERWLSVNCMDPRGEVAAVLYQISSRLFFLAAKSQEQVTDDYRAMVANIQSMAASLQDALNRSA